MVNSVQENTEKVELIVEGPITLEEYLSTPDIVEDTECDVEWDTDAIVDEFLGDEIKV